MYEDHTSANVIADSVSPSGYRITTMEVVFPRFILAEFNTHRAFSRNSASSRARSARKVADEVIDSPFMPATFPSEQRGMSGGPSLSHAMEISAWATWDAALTNAYDAARKLIALGVHKSITNRLLEPFMWHTVVVTATDWDNFFEQRLACYDDGTPMSQLEMYHLASEMRNALSNSKPREVDTGEWHLPYITERDHAEVRATTTPFSQTKLCQISVARCAGVSYLTHSTANREHQRDLGIYHKLINAQPPHWSPFEHVASPNGGEQRDNFRGWDSYRSIVSNLPRSE